MVPLIEIAFFVVIGNAIGLWPTLAGVLITAVVGSLVLRYQGMAVFNDMRQQMNRGQVPAKAMADAALIGAGGLMLLLPGYFSDNAVTLLPGRQTELTFTPRHGAKPSPTELVQSLKVRNLRDTF